MKKKYAGLLILLSILFLFAGCSSAPKIDPELAEPNAEKGSLLYHSDMDSSESVKDWIMEGPGEVQFSEGAMEMFSPDEKFHHVFWNPMDFPESFIAEWTVQNLKTEAGLCIVFFAAKGQEGEDLFDSSLPERKGVFTKYTKGKINTYHISYYANGKDNPDRETANLRKNRGFHWVQTGFQGVPLESENNHRIRLIKKNEHIAMYIDERLVINWKDDAQLGEILSDGKIGLRQMKWTHFKYSDFSVWTIVE